MITLTTANATCPTPSRRMASNKLRGASLRTTHIRNKNPRGVPPPVWKSGEHSRLFTFQRPSSGNWNLDSREWDQAWQRGLVSKTKPLSKPKDNIFTAELAVQLTAALILLTTLAPQTLFNEEKASMFRFEFLLAATLFYFWGAVSILPSWQLALQGKKHEERASSQKILGAAMLVSGGTIGAGIVALPVKTAMAGLLPSTACLVGGWAYMLLAALLIVEVNMHCGAGSNFTSMAEKLLGKRWKVICAALYIFVYSATLTAYIAESATFLAAIMRFGSGIFAIVGLLIHSSVLSLTFTAICGGVIGLGSNVVDRVNSVCLGIAFVAFAVLLACSGSTLRAEALLYHKWSGVFRMLPIMVVAFTFHNMIPSLAAYLGSRSATRKALVIGTSIPLVMYIIWEVLILGSLPPGMSIASVPEVLQLLGGNRMVSTAVNVFSLFAIITSFLGVGMGCVDFLQDLVGKSARPALSRTSLLLLTMVLPAGIACFFPKLFVAALEMSGIVRLVLFAIIPALMMMKGPWAAFKMRGYMVVAFFSLVSAAIIGIDLLGKLSLF